MRIRITSKLRPSETRRLRSASQNVNAAFEHTGRMTYEALYVSDLQAREYQERDGDKAERAYAHDVARNMMVVAGTTFEYELTGD